MKKIISKKIVKGAIPTFAPLFPGFYETWFSFDEERLMEDITEHYNVKWKAWDVLDHIEYSRHREDSAKLVCDFLEKELCDFVKSISYERIKSPREYNFETDAIYCEIVPKKKAIRDYIHKHKDLLDGWLRQRYTSRDGFISWYSNSYAAWQEETNDFRNLEMDNGHRLGTLLEFILLNEWSDLDDSEGSVQSSMYEYVRDHISMESEYLDNKFFQMHESVIKSIQNNYQAKSILAAVTAELSEETLEIFNVEEIILKTVAEIEGHTLEIQF